MYACMYGMCSIINNNLFGDHKIINLFFNLHTHILIKACIFYMLNEVWMGPMYMCIIIIVNQIAVTYNSVAIVLRSVSSS